MSEHAAPARDDLPHEGGHCPRCGEGVLHLIAENADGVTLQCWNCDTRGSIPNDGSFVASVDPDVDSPTGFTVTHAQLAGRREAAKATQVDTEQTVQRAGSDTDQGGGGGGA